MADSPYGRLSYAGIVSPENNWKQGYRMPRPVEDLPPSYGDQLREAIKRLMFMHLFGGAQMPQKDTQ